MNKSNLFLEQLKNVTLIQFGRILATSVLCPSTGTEDKNLDERSKTSLFYLHTQRIYNPNVDYVHSNTAGIGSTAGTV